MQITGEEKLQAAKDNAEKYVDRFKHVAENAFLEGAEWVMRMIDQKLKEESNEKV